MKNENLICPICGEPTYLHFGNPRKDRLCRKHGTMEHKGEIVQCEDCGNWNNVGENCPCKNSKKEITKGFSKEDSTSELICLTCDKPSNGRHFCYECWNLYKKKTIYLKIVDCKNIVNLGAEYEGHLETKDGHIVKSHVERDIDNYLFSKNIPHAYESSYDVDGDPLHEFKPDFYLPNYLGENKDVFIEYFGMKGTKDGDKKIEYKIPIYKRDKATLICLYPQDDSKIESVLKRKLNKDRIKEGELNWFEE